MPYLMLAEKWSIGIPMIRNIRTWNRFREGGQFGKGHQEYRDGQKVSQVHLEIILSWFQEVCQYKYILYPYTVTRKKTTPLQSGISPELGGPFLFLRESQNLDEYAVPM